MAQDTIPYPRTTAAQPHLSRSGKEEIRLKMEKERRLKELEASQAAEKKKNAVKEVKENEEVIYHF